MTSSFLLLFAAALCFAVCSCGSTRPPSVAKRPCEFFAIKKCNGRFKKVFTGAKAVAGKHTSGYKLAQRVYCRALQTFMNCLERSLVKCSDGAWLPEYSFVVLEHGVMDQKCGVCPGHQYRGLEKALNANSKQEYVGSDDCPRCAKGVHERCVKRFLHKMTADANMCNDLQEFITCYKEEGEPEKPCAAATIVRKFSNLCRQLGEKMLNEEKNNAGLKLC